MHIYIHEGKELSSHKGESLWWDDFVLVLLQYFPGHISCWWLSSSKWDLKVRTDGGCAVGADGFSVSYLGKLPGSPWRVCGRVLLLAVQQPGWSSLQSLAQVSQGHVGGRPGAECRMSTSWSATPRWTTRFLLILLKLFDSTEIFLSWLFLTEIHPQRRNTMKCLRFL